MEDSRLRGMVGKKRMAVNSAHHQAIKKVGRRLRVCAEAEDGVIEAIERAGDGFCLGLQWHAEQMAGDPLNRKIFLAFFKACREAREGSL
jgi:putative glutamine amidotransferase